MLEALREPLQDKKVHIARVNAKVEYASDIMFVAAQNPCPCGNLLSKRKVCRCSDSEIKRYKSKLSDPFLDRIDIFVVMQEVEVGAKADMDSKTIHKMVIDAFKRQKLRGQKRLNGKLTEQEIQKYVKLDTESQKVLNVAISNFSLSHRSIASIKKIARTIADLDAQETISKRHMLEALSFRRR